MSKHIVQIVDLKEGLLEVANILNHLRETTKFWEQHYGSEPKLQKKRWEKKADEWLSKHCIKVDE